MSEANIIIGRNSVTEALKAGRSITKLYVAAGNESQPLQRIRDLADRKEILVEDVPLKVLNHLAPGNRHQGVIAFAKPVEYADLTDVLIAADEKGNLRHVLIALNFFKKLFLCQPVVSVLEIPAEQQIAP